MPLDETNMRNNGGWNDGPGSDEFEKAMAVILALSARFRPTFEVTGVQTTERVAFELVLINSADGRQFSPFGMVVREWVKLEFEDPENDPAKKRPPPNWKTES